MTNINTSSIASNRLSRITRSAADKRREALEDRDGFLPPPRPHINFIPTPDILRDLIDRAVQALTRGIYWDRGSIINIVL